MKITIKGYLFHKDAEGFADCFDRYAVNTLNHKFAVSDGVSKSFFPGIWADLVVKSFVETPGRADLADAGLLRSIQKKWSDLVSEIVHRPNQKYYVRNFFAQGRSAAATFVGLHFFQEGYNYRWEAFALGDSFLFFIPQGVDNLDQQFGQVIHLSSKKDLQFDNFPDHFDSLNLSNKGKIKQTKHDLMPGTFLLMTDALSEWFIAEKSNALKEIKSWRDQTFFEQRITQLRKGKIPNDDAAILFLEVTDDRQQGINYSQVCVSELDFLLDPVNNTMVPLPDFGNMVDEISQKFGQAPNVDELVNIQLTDRKEALDNEGANTAANMSTEPPVAAESKPDYLAHRNRVKQKKRSLIQRAIDDITGLFGTKHPKQLETNQKRDDAPPKHDNDGDINAITDKF